MSRFKTQFQTPFTADAVFKITADYLKSEGYNYVEYSGENVWKKGSGWVSGPTFIKLAYSNNTVFLEAWLKYALLPGVYVGEMGLDGFFGIAVKNVLKNRVDILVKRLTGIYQQQPNGQFAPQNQQYSPQQSNGQYAPQQQNQQYTPQQQNAQFAPQQQNGQYVPQQQNQQNGQFPQQ